MNGSPMDALQDAIEKTRRGLFPFRFSHWLPLAFVAFLDQCGRKSGGGFNVPNLPVPPDRNDSPESLFRTADPSFDEALAWVSAHAALVAVLVIAGILLVVGFAALVLWINSRGIFMYIDAVANGRAEVSRSWNENRERANAFFRWRFAVGMAGLGVMLLLFAAGGVLVWQWQRGTLTGSLALAIGGIGLLPIVLAVALGLALFELLLRDLAAPLSWRYGWSAGDALRTAYELARANLGSMVVYILLKIVFAIGGAIVAMLAGCLTCCLGFLPVVSQFLLQPLWFFERAWSLQMLRRLGHDVFPAEVQA
jgi:hypothetical protein